MNDIPVDGIIEYADDDEVMERARALIIKWQPALDMLAER